MTDRCMCGDTQCPSCGSAQGTYEPGWTDELQEQRDIVKAEHLRDWMSDPKRIEQHLADAFEAGHTQSHAAVGKLIRHFPKKQAELTAELHDAAYDDLYEYALGWIQSGRALPSAYPRID